MIVPWAVVACEFASVASNVSMRKQLGRAPLSSQRSRIRALVEQGKTWLPGCAEKAGGRYCRRFGKYGRRNAGDG